MELGKAGTEVGKEARREEMLSSVVQTFCQMLFCLLLCLPWLLRSPFLVFTQRASSVGKGGRMSRNIPSKANLHNCRMFQGSSGLVLRSCLKPHQDLAAHTPMLNGKRTHRELSLSHEKCQQERSYCERLWTSGQTLYWME